MNLSYEIRRLLPDTCSIGQNILYFEEIDSTNNYAKQLAVQGSPHGTVIIADRQTAGRGRLGRRFHSPEGGLYLSVILRPQILPTDMMAMTACAACAVFSALSEFHIYPEIKWVNDLFLHSRKICGILCEGSFLDAQNPPDFLVVGIGLNLRPDPHLPQELRSIVTDIFTETGQDIPKINLISAILRHLEHFTSTIREKTFLPIYAEHSYTLGKRMIVLHEGAERECLAVGYHEDAGLVVQFPDGTKAVIHTGTARFADE